MLPNVFSSVQRSVMTSVLYAQGKWLYLEPIFSSEEIMKQIPKEGSAFRQMDATWRNIMAAVKLCPAIIEVRPGLTDDPAAFAAACSG